MTTTLLIPNKTYRKGLIGDGLCGSRAPVAFRWLHAPPPHDIWRTAKSYTQDDIRQGLAPDAVTALVLCLDGELVDDGLERLSRWVAGYQPWNARNWLDRVVSGTYIHALGTVVLAADIFI